MVEKNYKNDFYDVVLLKLDILKTINCYDEMALESAELLKRAVLENRPVTKEIRKAFGTSFQNIITPARISYKNGIILHEKYQASFKDIDSLKLDEKENLLLKMSLIKEILDKQKIKILETSNKVISFIDVSKILPIEKVEDLTVDPPISDNPDKVSSNINPSITTTPISTTASNISPENLTFFAKLKGDYYRYQCEVLSGKELERAQELAYKYYNQAQKASEGLKHANSVKLSLALNMSVMEYEILGNPQKACKIAETAFEQALYEIELLKKDAYVDSISILQMMKDNLYLWSYQHRGIRNTESINTENGESKEHNHQGHNE